MKKYECDCGRSFDDPDGPVMCANSVHGTGGLEWIEMAQEKDLIIGELWNEIVGLAELYHERVCGLKNWHTYRACPKDICFHNAKLINKTMREWAKFWPKKPYEAAIAAYKKGKFNDK